MTSAKSSGLTSKLIKRKSSQNFGSSIDVGVMGTPAQSRTTFQDRCVKCSKVVSSFLRVEKKDIAIPTVVCAVILATCTVSRAAKMRKKHKTESASRETPITRNLARQGSKLPD